jgi:hypothetical protein
MRGCGPCRKSVLSLRPAGSQGAAISTSSHRRLPGAATCLGHSTGGTTLRCVRCGSLWATVGCGWRRAYLSRTWTSGCGRPASAGVCATICRGVCREALCPSTSPVPYGCCGRSTSRRQREARRWARVRWARVRWARVRWARVRRWARWRRARRGRRVAWRRRWARRWRAVRWCASALCEG